MNIKELKELKEEIVKRSNNKEYIQNDITSLLLKKKQLRKYKLMKERALELVKDVSLNTQKQLEVYLNEMVSSALNSVFDQEYEFVIQFQKRRGKTECNLYFKKEEHLVDPLRFSGLGASDVAAFALRCACWSMNKEYRNVLILDEPLKHLSSNYHERAGKMMKMLSKELNLQIIIVSHSKKVTEYADKVYEVIMKNGISKVKGISGVNEVNEI